MPNKVKYFTQEVVAKTQIFGKEYFWMKDIDGTLYLVGTDSDGNPAF